MAVAQAAEAHAMKGNIQALSLLTSLPPQGALIVDARCVDVSIHADSHRVHAVSSEVLHLLAGGQAEGQVQCLFCPEYI